VLALMTDPSSGYFPAMRFRSFALLTLLAVCLGCTGCGSFVAHRMVQAPNTYPAWLAPPAPVELAFDPALLTNFAAHVVDIGPPPARLHYRLFEPADYAFSVSSTNWLERGRKHFRFTFHATVPGRTNAWTATPRGTVVLIHGYGMGGFVMAPWALRLAEEGWRCVLVDLRGHGKSTGRRIAYGLQETHDLNQLLDALSATNQLAAPVAVLGESYGAALALRWKAADARVASAVAIAPYASLSNAVLNLCHEYSSWFPSCLLRAGLKHLPKLLEVAPQELDTTTVLSRQPVAALFVAGAEDRVIPPADVQGLFEQCATGSEFLIVPNATHEAIPYFFDDLAPPVLAWLRNTPASASPAQGCTPTR
jgi:pimeloyl-ACP methyl ester carboxylesterase